MIIMPQIKSVQQSSEKWARRAGQSSQDYAAGVKSPRTSWAEAAAGASEAQHAGAQAAISNNSYEKGVRAAGDSKWSRKATTVGASRFGPGVAAAKSDYEQGFAPYAQVIQGVQLPPRGAKGDPRNFERVQVIGTALHEAKVNK